MVNFSFEKQMFVASNGNTDSATNGNFLLVRKEMTVESERNTNSAAHGHVPLIWKTNMYEA